MSFELSVAPLAAAQDLRGLGVPTRQSAADRYRRNHHRPQPVPGRRTSRRHRPVSTRLRSRTQSRALERSQFILVGLQSHPRRSTEPGLVRDFQELHGASDVTPSRRSSSSVRTAIRSRRSDAERIVHSSCCTTTPRTPSSANSSARRGGTGRTRACPTSTPAGFDLEAAAI